MPAPPTVTIVMPVLDEAAALAPRLARLVAEADEVIVSDGGSRDATVAVARQAGARVVCGPPGRGAQLARGAAAAGGEVILFLHADTDLPDGGVERVRAAVRSGAAWGAFRIRFDAAGLAYRLGERVIGVRTRWLRVPLGDQAQFATREALAQAGGVRELPILEDVDLARRLRRSRRGDRFALLSPPVTTSARRFEQRGKVRTVATNWLIWTLWACGVAPARLARLYRHVR